MSEKSKVREAGDAEAGAARRGRPPSDKILERLTSAALKIIEDEDVSSLTIERVCKLANKQQHSRQAVGRWRLVILHRMLGLS